MLILNELETGSEAASFGGAMVISAQGDLLAELPYGTDQSITWEFECIGPRRWKGCSTKVSRLIRRSVLLGFDFITIEYSPYPASIVCRCLMLPDVDSCFFLRDKPLSRESVSGPFAGIGKNA